MGDVKREYYEWSDVEDDDKHDLESLGWDEDKWKIYIDYKKNEKEDKYLKFINL